MSLRMIISDKRYAPLFWAQFFGALNDNVFKNALVMLVTFRGVSVAGLDPGSVVALAGGIFILPFFLLSPLAGQVSDKMEKSRLVRLTKFWEVAIMAVAAVGFFTHQFGFLLLVLFGAGVQAALFGPVKYSLLPELVGKGRLVEANAYVETGTFLAILIGTLIGGLLVKLPGSHVYISATLLALAVLGLVSGMAVPRVPPSAPDLKVRLNPWPGFASTHRILRHRRDVYDSVVEISWFWFFGAAVLSILPVYCKDYLRVDEGVVTAFLAMFTVGIGLGSILCERLSFRRVELGLVPFGALGLSLFLFDLCLARPSWPMGFELIGLGEFLHRPGGLRILADFLLMSVSGGFFILPLYTLLQERSPAAERSRVIAGNNIMNAVFMVGASLLVMGFHAWSLSYPAMFMILALLNLIAMSYLLVAVPEARRRWRGWTKARLWARLRGVGEGSLPATGPVLLRVSRALTAVDRRVIEVLLPRPVRFLSGDAESVIAALRAGEAVCVESALDEVVDFSAPHLLLELPERWASGEALRLRPLGAANFPVHEA